jgi:hypothetical protein
MKKISDIYTQILGEAKQEYKKGETVWFATRGGDSLETEVVSYDSKANTYSLKIVDGKGKGKIVNDVDPYDIEADES